VSICSVCNVCVCVHACVRGVCVCVHVRAFVWVCSVGVGTLVCAALLQYNWQLNHVLHIGDTCPLV